MSTHNIYNGESFVITPTGESMRTMVHNIVNEEPLATKGNVIYICN